MKSWLKAKWMNFAMWIAFGLSVMGCTNSNAKWHADSRFTDEERASIVEGMTWLEQQSGRDFGGVDFTYEVTSEQPLPHTIRREQGPSVATGECAYGNVMYLAFDGVPAINSPRVDKKFQPGLTAHEMAHCELGFVDGYKENDTKTDGIMRNLFPMQWTAVEQEQLEKNSK